MLPIENTLELLQKVESEKLFRHLILQLNKDFQLSNLSETFEVSYTPIQLKDVLSKVILHILTGNYDDYLNLMYRIDVPEKELVTIKSNHLETTVEQITFLILKREYQKVWFKNRL